MGNVLEFQGLRGTLAPSSDLPAVDYCEANHGISAPPFGGIELTEAQAEAVKRAIVPPRRGNVVSMLSAVSMLDKGAFSPLTDDEAAALAEFHAAQKPEPSEFERVVLAEQAEIDRRNAMPQRKASKFERRTMRQLVQQSLRETGSVLGRKKSYAKLVAHELVRVMTK